MRVSCAWKSSSGQRSRRLTAAAICTVSTALGAGAASSGMEPPLDALVDELACVDGEAGGNKAWARIVFHDQDRLTAVHSGRAYTAQRGVPRCPCVHRACDSGTGRWPDAPATGPAIHSAALQTSLLTAVRHGRGPDGGPPVTMSGATPHRPVPVASYPGSPWRRCVVSGSASGCRLSPP